MSSVNIPLDLALPTGSYGYVGLAATGVFFLNVFQLMKVAAARKRAKIPYPQLYAEKAEAEASKDAYVFNCAQRAHHNTLETLPTFIMGLFYSGLKHPRLAAGFGAAWIVGRILYTIGYTTGNPSQRNKRGGALHNVGILGLWVTSIWTTYDILLAQDFAF